MNSLIEELNSGASINDIIGKINELVRSRNQELKEYVNVNVENNNFAELTLNTAIALVPVSRRSRGIRVRFIEVSQGWVEYIWLGEGQWDDLAGWTKETINGGDWV